MAKIRLEDDLSSWSGVAGPPETFPVLPDSQLLFQQINRLSASIEQHKADDQTLIRFYYPLVALSYRLLHTSLDKLRFFPPNSSLLELSVQLYSYLTNIGRVMERLIEIMAKGNPVAEQMFIAYSQEYVNQPFQWNGVTIVWIIEWLQYIFNPDNHRGTPPFFIYISIDSGKKFPPVLPKMFEATTWLTGFGNRLVVTDGALNLTISQKAELWNHLLVEQSIYDDKNIDHSSREQVFRQVAAFFPGGEIRHLDLCGGRGDFIDWLKIYKPEVQSFLIDNANKAVQEAQAREIRAQVGNAEESLQAVEKPEVITVIYALQWITEKALGNIFEALIPGGIFIGNVYPASWEKTEQYVKVLEGLGFDDVKYVTIELSNGKREYIIKARKPF